MGAPDFSVRIDQAQDAMAKLRVKIGKISKAQMRDIYAANIPFVRATNDMLGKVIEAADVGFAAYAATAAIGVATGGIGLLVIPFVAYGESKWKNEAGNLKWRLSSMSSNVTEAVNLPDDETEWTPYGLLTANEIILDLCQKSWAFYGKFSDSFYKMAADFINTCGALLNRFLQVVKAVLNFVGEALKGASNALAWIGPLLTVLIPVAALGGLIYLAKTGTGAIREAGTPGHTRMPRMPRIRLPRRGGGALPPPDYDI